jgi:glycosyltransferase involved in cell wall biosynthesis
VCEIGTAHYPQQWTNLFLSAWNGTMRATDGFIFKARAAEKLYREVWREWGSRTGLLPFPRATVIANGIDLGANSHSESLRSETRRQLGLGPRDVAFLTFSRLAPGTKGDYRALLFLWKRLVERSPNAILVLSGKGFDRGFLLHLRTSARQAGLGNNLIMAEDPFEVWPDARDRLMSAADVFLHLSTGAEEVCPNSVLEAMAFGLPVVASHWAGLPELVADGENGFLIPTLLSEPPPALQRMMLSRDPPETNSDLGRCVGCDGEAFVRAASTLLLQEQTRKEMGQRSRRRAERLFSMTDMAGRRVDFFDDVRRHAGRAPEGQRKPLQDLVSFRSILWSMGNRPLQPEDVVAIVREDGFSFLRAAPSMSRDESTIALVEFVLREGAPMNVAELVSRVHLLARTDAEMAGPEPSADTWRACTRMLVRLISYGVINVVGAEAGSASATHQAVAI